MDLSQTTHSPDHLWPRLSLLAHQAQEAALRVGNLPHRHLHGRVEAHRQASVPQTEARLGSAV
jgi:hypothetical protein